MILQNEVCTATVDIDERYVLEIDDKDYDVVFNPKRLKNRDAYAAVCVTAKTDKAIKIAIVCEYKVEFSAVLFGSEIDLAVNGDAIRFDLKDGTLLNYEKDALKDEFDFSELDKLIDW